MTANTPLHIAIVGAGIGGLTTAIALRRVGLQVDVFEQAPELNELGAGIGIGPNATLVLKRLGLEEQVATITTPLRAFIMRRWDGQVLNQQELSSSSNTLMGSPAHRAELSTMLRSALPDEVMHLGKRCVKLEQDATQVQLTFADGSTATADAVVGADGIHSVVRNTYHTDQPIFS